MAYDTRLAERVENLLGDRDGLEIRKMFGGLAYLLNGNMACGVVDDLVVLRLGNEGAEQALDEDFIAPMDFTGENPFVRWCICCRKGTRRVRG